MVALKYRTDDNAQWGAGLGRDLQPEEIDQNFYDVEKRLEAVEQNPVLPNEIEAISVDGNRMSITMADHSVFGPYILPQAAFRFTGAFQPNHNYRLYDFLVSNDGLYLVLRDFISGDAFLFGADAEGPFYQFVMPFPSNYDIAFFFPGQPGLGIAAGAAMFAFRASARTPFYLPAGLPDSSAGLAVAPTAALSCAIHKDATQIGTLDFAPGSTAGICTFDEAIQFNAGNTLRVIRPTALDDTALDLSILFAAVKGTP
ncbi:MAG: hypothetical protein KGK33_08835 [Hyphomicrobiales bacterium]|nr:hypothetical protein [Hyphomicrobiales bacterium]